MTDTERLGFFLLEQHQRKKKNQTVKSNSIFQAANKLEIHQSGLAKLTQAMQGAHTHIAVSKHAAGSCSCHLGLSAIAMQDR